MTTTKSLTIEIDGGQLKLKCLINKNLKPLPSTTWVEIYTNSPGYDDTQILEAWDNEKYIIETYIKLKNDIIPQDFINTATQINLTAKQLKKQYTKLIKQGIKHGMVVISNDLIQSVLSFINQDNDPIQ